MPWLRVKLRGKVVFARADGQGQLLAESGRVEIRYNPNDGRMYRAAARNLIVDDPTLLPDDICGPAAAVEAQKTAKKTAKKSKKAAKSAAPLVVPDGIVAYTDGACSGNPGPAGLGVLIQDGDRTVERYEFLGNGTNNIAELTAILRALEEIDPNEAATVLTDSQYAIGVLQKGWKAKANKELVATLRDAMDGRAVRLVYVKGHAGIEGNERADALARQAVEERGDGRKEEG